MKVCKTRISDTVNTIRVNLLLIMSTLCLNVNKQHPTNIFSAAPKNNLILLNSEGVSRIKCQVIFDKLLDCAVSVFPICLVHACETNIDFGITSHIIHATL